MQVRQSDAADDFTPAAVCVGPYNVGDTDHDNLLDVGEIWHYTSVGTAGGGAKAQAGLHTNVVTAVGTDSRLTARTHNRYRFGQLFWQDSTIRIEKAINAENPVNPTRYEDADLPQVLS